jgi:hypothetical protein
MLWNDIGLPVEERFIPHLSKVKVVGIFNIFFVFILLHYILWLVAVLKLLPGSNLFIL